MRRDHRQDDAQCPKDDFRHGASFPLGGDGKVTPLVRWVNVRFGWRRRTSLWPRLLSAAKQRGVAGEGNARQVLGDVEVRFIERRATLLSGAAVVGRTGSRSKRRCV